MIVKSPIYWKEKGHLMEKSNNNLKAHLIVCTSCTYQMENGQESTPENAVDLRKSIKDEVVPKYGKNNVRVTAVNCLGECSNGIATVIYPKGEWNLGVRPEDRETLIQKIDELCK